MDVFVTLWLLDGVLVAVAVFDAVSPGPVTVGVSVLDIAFADNELDFVNVS